MNTVHVKIEHKGPLLTAVAFHSLVGFFDSSYPYLHNLYVTPRTKLWIEDMLRAKMKVCSVCKGRPWINPRFSVADLVVIAKHAKLTGFKVVSYVSEDKCRDTCKDKCLMFNLPADPIKDLLYDGV